MVYLLTKSVGDDRKLQVCLHVRRFLVFFCIFILLSHRSVLTLMIPVVHSC